VIVTIIMIVTVIITVKEKEKEKDLVKGHEIVKVMVKEMEK